MNRCISTKVFDRRTGSQRRLPGHSRASTAPAMIVSPTASTSVKNADWPARTMLATSITSRATGVSSRQSLCEKKPKNAGLPKGLASRGRNCSSWKLPASVRILRRRSCAIDDEGRS